MQAAFDMMKYHYARGGSVSDILHEIKAEKKKVNTLLSAIAEKTPEEMPQGMLEILHARGRIMYYRVVNGERHYLRKSESDLAGVLAERRYLEQLRTILRKERDVLQFMEKTYRPFKKYELFDSLSNDRKALFQPLIEPDDVFQEKWLTDLRTAKDTSPNEIAFKTSYETDGGDLVRSKSEKILADLFHSMNVPYVYEAPLKTKGILFYPDFTLLNLNSRRTFYWEHFGLMDDPSYTGRIPYKLGKYASASIYPGEQLITSWESSNCVLDIRLIKQMITHYLL